MSFNHNVICDAEECVNPDGRLLNWEFEKQTETFRNVIDALIEKGWHFREGREDLALCPPCAKDPRRRIVRPIP